MPEAAPTEDAQAPSPTLTDEPAPRSAEPQDPHLLAPLAGLEGAEPPAPEWFRKAVAAPHERAFVTVEGAAIEWLAWGRPGDPGLLLLHGNGANADWWRFTAPLLADGGLRVAALSWSGMGNSGHRPAYALDLFLAEALAVAQAAALGPRFAVAGHSFGGVPAAALAARHADRLTRAIVIDTPFALMGGDRRPPRGPARPHRVYPTLAAALARFRWAPVQPSPNLWATDFIARTSLKEVPGGFTWKFDPYLWEHFRFGDPNALLAAAHAPLDYVWGEKSLLVGAGVVQAVRRRAPAGTRFVGIPDAHHHVMADQPIALVATVRALLA
ncbi:MAG: alpha/beta hydrolase [Sphingomonadaceae bacterium]|uniref:alpha/beta fold hydrolase n=1 Tax=Thermaurantiacus sp. TaxID=2820283 RepID=UPI00298F392F|nr:alpha/beta hydrolase [Thermaurantiacus sp.]MCS6987425.1 alpha/beta hydrolase [Sphingomonadaceae bacterium]MDW8415345.1 alpha/beta hydrolase [Thermaurantiacus sp.]